MGRKRIVTTLTVAEYEAAKRAEAAAANSPFTYNTRTKEMKVDLNKLRELVKAAAKSKRVCRESEKAVKVSDLH